MRVALALILASVVASALACAWLIVLLRRIRLEEAYLRSLFGVDYDRYAARTTG